MQTISSGLPPSDADIYLPGHMGLLAREGPRAADRLIEFWAEPHPRSAEPPVERQALRDGVPEIVIRPDERRAVGDTRAFPYSTICSLEIVNSKQEKFYGTGFLAGPRLVLTAGHNVYFHGEGFMQQITVFPGLNGDRAAPRFRSAKASSFLTVEVWVNDADRQFDFGAIVLPTDLGRDAGWLAISNFTEPTLASSTVTIAGYPQAPPTRPSSQFPQDASTLWHHNGRLQRVEPNRLLHQIDTTRGQSGSPLIAHFPAKDDAYHAVGIHNTSFESTNAATRINRAVFSQILQWRQLSDGVARTA